MKINLDQSDLSPTIAKTISEVYAFLMERRIERKIAARVTNTENFILTKSTDLKIEDTE